MESKVRSFSDWLYNPRPEEKICTNPFRDTVYQVFTEHPEAYNPFTSPDPEALQTKLANLIRAQLILLSGDVIYIREGTQLHTLGDAIDLLAFYLHTDTREARRGADLLESEFLGYFPVNDNLVNRNTIRLITPTGNSFAVDLATLKKIPEGQSNYYEFGTHHVSEECYMPLVNMFAYMNQALGHDFLLEKILMYQFRQAYREKSFVLVGNGGNGKSMFMGLVGRLFGDKALIDAPQPNFRGHDAAVIAYSLIGKRMVTFNDVGDPSVQFLEWLKRMITGNLEVKTPSGAWLSVPCSANFLMETNHKPQVLDLEAHRRRFVISTFDDNFKLKDYLPDEQLDILGERGIVTAGDIVHYLMTTIAPNVDDWTNFE